MYENNGYQLYDIDDVACINDDVIRSISRNSLNKKLTELLEALNCDKIYAEADNCVIMDTDNKKYIDFIGAYGAMNLGNNNPYVKKALDKVKDKLNLAYIGINPYEAALADNLVKMTRHQLERVFFCNSGSEAVESALKLARAATGRSRILYCENSYHGKSFGALTVTGQVHYRQKFEPLVPDMDQLPFGDLAALEQELAKGAAAFIVEPIQGEGGVIMAPANYLKEVRALCEKYGVLLILDEVQTGFGRTGSFFAYEQEDMVPDILCLAKSLGGGVIPVGACISKGWVYEKAYGEQSTCMLHSSTFGGNTYACAAGIAAIEGIVKEELVKQCREKGEFLISELRRLKENYYGIRDVRGRGLMIGVEFEDKIAAGQEGSVLPFNSYGAYIASSLLNEYGIITAYSTNNGNLIRLEPPLTITYEQLESLLSALRNLLLVKLK